jgi:hypothetical protein
VPTRPAAIDITTTFARPPRRRRRVEGRGVDETCWARSVVRVAGTCGWDVVAGTAPRAVFLM